MKKLKKILLINWLYFSKQLIEVEDINFLTGKNGAGKSTVIDALQIVLLGETNARNFNQAANEKSQRTLDGYLRADMDDNNPHSRRGRDFSSYIACEFRDEVNGTQFVSGIVFECRRDGSRQERFFLYDGVLPENCFVMNGEAMDIPDLRSFLKQQYGIRAKLYDTQKQYRTDMLAKWNVHSEQITRMLKKAVSFRPIVDIQKFLTENICDLPDRPDIEAMQQNIRDYKRHELLAQRQEEKLATLQSISKLHREMCAAMERWRQQSFLVLWAKKESIEAEISKKTLEREDCERQMKHCGDQVSRLSEQIEEKEKEKEELKSLCDNSDVSREQSRLLGEKNRLIEEQVKLHKRLQNEAQEIKREAVVISGLCQEVLGWEHDDVLAAVEEQARTLTDVYSAFCDCQYDVFSKPLAVFEHAQELTAAFKAAVRDAAYQTDSILAQLKSEQDEKRALLANLQKNIKAYPKGLLQLKRRIHTELEENKKRPVQIDILADVLEIPEREENWRRAVEGYLHTQKFYLLVAPEVYSDALHVFDAVKREYQGASFGLVDVGKLRKRERIDPWADSLAKKIETDNPLARSYIDYLLGRVVCCAHADQLRKHKTSITADGMVYQGYVARPIRQVWMDDAFIGRRAVELQVSRLEREQRELERSLRRWNPIHQILARHKDRDTLFTRYFVQSTVVQRQEDYLRGLEINSQLEQIEDAISHLDLFWLEEQRGRIAKLKEEIKRLDDDRIQRSSEKGRLEQRIHQLEYDILPELYQSESGTEDQLRERFTADFTQQIGIPRYEQELKRLRTARVVAKNFGDQLPKTEKERDTAQKTLFQARSEYNDSFKPCSFQVENMDNGEYEAEQRLLEESELPKYRAKIQAARESAMEQFQNDFLAKLKSSIDQVQDQVKSLNKALKQAQFGTDRYQFRVDRNPDYGEYYDMIMAPELMEGEVGLFALPFQQKYGSLIEDLFSRIALSDDTQLNARKQSELEQNILLYTDYRTYLKFDLETTDQNGSRQLLSQTLNTKSGGETQTPFYIAVLASFAQIYQVNNLSGLNNTVRLVVFDEAFNKMDSDRIVESVRLLRKMGLQAIICTPPDKLPDIMPLADRTLLVSKEKYRMHILSYGKEIHGE